MNSKRNLTLVVIAAALVCGILFYKKSTTAPQVETEKGTPLESAVSQAQPDTATPNLPTSATQAEPKQINNQTTNSHLPTPDEIDNRFPDVDSHSDFVSLVNQLLKDKETDKTGTSDIKIAKVLELCDNSPKNEEELKKEKQQFESFVSDSGRDNGQVQAGLADIDREYKSCQTVKHLVANKSAYDFYNNAAEVGHPVAEVLLATKIAPPDFNSFTKENKSAYQQKMGKILADARSKCEPTAFLAYGYAHDTLEPYKLWSSSDDVPSAINEYGNFVAYALYYERKTNGGQETVERFDNEVKVRYPQLAAYEIDKAKDYGHSLFNKYCLNN